MTTEAINNARWTGGPGLYEVWYATWNHAETGQGYWLRYVTDAPLDRPAYAELWFARFDPHDPRRTFGVHRRFHVETYAAKVQPFSVTIANSRIGHDHAFGALDGDGHQVEWDLRWEPAARSLEFFPALAYPLKIGSTWARSPNPRVAMTGKLVVDGEVLTFDRAPLGQTHVAGTKHAYSWFWGHCADLRGAPDALLEVLGVRLQRGSRTLPRLVMVRLDLDGERHELNQFRHLVRNTATWRGQRIELSAQSATTKIDATLEAAPDHMLVAPYLDPDGTRVYCTNTEIGDARITISKRRGFGWRVERTLEAAGTAHFELGGRERDPAVEREHVTVE
jgi:hypothetical protein